MVEITDPWETNLPKQNLIKCNKYHNLVSVTMQAGFMTYFYSLEIGARSLLPKYMYTMLRELGLGRGKRKEFLNSISKLVVNA